MKTENLKISILDLLSILLPGAILLALLSVLPITNVYYNQFYNLKEDWLKATIITGMAYILGHFIFIIASKLDDWIYTPVKRVFYNRTELLAYVAQARNTHEDLYKKNIFNNFKWACAYLLKNEPAMYSSLESIVATSKFFRSLVIVFLVGCIIFVTQYQWLWVILFLSFSILSLHRYITERQKSIDTAYQYVLVSLSEKNPDLLTNKPDEQIMNVLQEQNNEISVNYFLTPIKNIQQILLQIFLRMKKSFQKTSPIKTHELRWFSEIENERILSWFHKKGMDFSNPESFEARKDVYILYTNSTDNSSIKLRNNQIEIKVKSNDGKVFPLTSNITGKLEKWSKNILDKMETSIFLKSDRYKNALHIEVHKKRMGIKIVKGHTKNPIFISMNARVPNGCQLEYTKITINNNNKIIYTLALEWFGKSNSFLHEKLISELFGDTQLDYEHSFGYDEFLKRYSQSM